MDGIDSITPKQKASLAKETKEKKKNQGKFESMQFSQGCVMFIDFCILMKSFHPLKISYFLCSYFEKHLHIAQDSIQIGFFFFFFTYLQFLFSQKRVIQLRPIGYNDIAQTQAKKFSFSIYIFYLKKFYNCSIYVIMIQCTPRTFNPSTKETVFFFSSTIKLFN